MERNIAVPEKLATPLDAFPEGCPSGFWHSIFKAGWDTLPTSWQTVDPDDIRHYLLRCCEKPPVCQLTNTLVARCDIVPNSGGTPLPELFLACLAQAC